MGRISRKEERKRKNREERRKKEERKKRKEEESEKEEVENENIELLEEIYCGKNMEDYIIKSMFFFKV